MAAAADTDEAERVLINRLERFAALPDVTYPQAMELALSGADLHLAEDMAAQGCTPVLLIAILV